jgi:tRNA modification GTPase
MPPANAMRQSDTIFALSSGAPPSGVAIIRISGSKAKVAVVQLCGAVPADRKVELVNVRDKAGELLDRGLVVVFSAPRSFTGEDCAELHIHGGRASIAAVIDALGHFDGFRQADAGEFTRRAFVNGKMDLTGVEALGDLISAETAMQRRFALANADGSAKAFYYGWRQRLLHARAMIEAELDFSDEGDVPGSMADEVWRDVAALAAEMGAKVASARKAEVLRDGFRVVILGAPNAGKSSLINKLADRDVAIVSDEAGTTRDLVEVVLDLDGVRVVITDTAGLRDEPGTIEALGIARALERAADSDLVLVLEDLSEPVSIDAPPECEVLRIGSKFDICVAERGVEYDLLISAKTGAGLDELIERIRSAALERVGGWSGDALPFRLRQVELIRDAREHLCSALSEERELELRAEALRLAGDAIGSIVGEIRTEDVLGRIFSQFCIGK